MWVSWARLYDARVFGQPDFVASRWGRAGDEARTRDVLLGKEVLYH